MPVHWQPRLSSARKTVISFALMSAFKKYPSCLTPERGFMLGCNSVVFSISKTSRSGAILQIVNNIPRYQASD